MEPSELGEATFIPDLLDWIPADALAVLQFHADGSLTLKMDNTLPSSTQLLIVGAFEAAAKDAARIIREAQAGGN